MNKNWSLDMFDVLSVRSQISRLLVLTSGSCLFVVGKSGGMDGTRTRGLRRDRPAL